MQRRKFIKNSTALMSMLPFIQINHPDIFKKNFTWIMKLLKLRLEK